MYSDVKKHTSKYGMPGVYCDYTTHSFQVHEIDLEEKTKKKSIMTKHFIQI